MKKECDNKEDSRIDSLPQESSTPRSKEKDYGTIILFNVVIVVGGGVFLQN